MQELSRQLSQAPSPWQDFEGTDSTIKVQMPFFE